MEVTISKAKSLKKVFESIKDLLNEVSLDVSSEHIEIMSMDSSHVSLTVLRLNPEFFEKFKCTKSFSFGFSILSFIKILKCANDDDKVVLKTKFESDKLEIFFNGSKKTQDFELKLLEIDQQQMGIPEQEYDYILKPDSKDFAASVRNIAGFTDTVSIEINDQKELVLSSAGDDVDIKMKFGNTEEDEMEVLESDSEPLKLAFAIKFINFFMKASTLSEKVEISISKDVPAIFKFDIENDGGFIKFYLAPKIDDQYIHIKIKNLKENQKKI